MTGLLLTIRALRTARGNITSVSSTPRIISAFTAWKCKQHVPEIVRYCIAPMQWDKVNYDIRGVLQQQQQVQRPPQQGANT
jgi:hypothetical protein